MSAAATRWISPFWGSIRFPTDPDAPGHEPETLGAARVYVLGLTKEGTVSANWFDTFGQLKHHEEVSLAFHHVAWFNAPEDGQGWLRLVSEGRPILPWGITPLYPTSLTNEHILPPIAGAATLVQWESMAFYPEDPLPHIPDLGPLPIP